MPWLPSEPCRCTASAALGGARARGDGLRECVGEALGEGVGEGVGKGVRGFPGCVHVRVRTFGMPVPSK